MDVTRVAFVILVGICMIFVVIRLINRVMERRDRPGQFILYVLMIVALIIFMIWLIATGGGT